MAKHTSAPAPDDEPDKNLPVTSLRNMRPQTGQSRRQMATRPGSVPAFPIATPIPLSLKQKLSRLALKLRVLFVFELIWPAARSGMRSSPH